MKRILLILTTLLSLNSQAAGSNPPGDFGVGLMIGSMTAVTGKYWFDKRSAVDFGLTFDDLGLYADYLFHVPTIFGKGSKFTRETAGYFGGGGGVVFWDDSYECGRWGCDRRTDKTETGIFLRAFAGFEWFAAPSRFGVFVELGPTILFAPETDTDFDIQIGGRYYF